MEGLCHKTLWVLPVETRGLSLKTAPDVFQGQCRAGTRRITATRPTGNGTTALHRQARVGFGGFQADKPTENGI